MMDDKLPDQLNMDKASSAFKNLAARTSYKKLLKTLDGRRGVFRGGYNPTREDDRDRVAREREREVARLRSEEFDCERLARESDRAGDFKRFARFWNRMDAARRDLVRLGAAGPGA
jgi:hypothetical protein